jgi:uncharacterized protein (DUF1778 family)
MLRKKRKSDRLWLRLHQEHKALIERAASAACQSVMEFAVSHLVQDARTVLREHEVTVLSDRDWGIFLSMLDADAEPNEALRKAASTYRQQRA